MELIEFNGKMYPKFQALGNAAQFAIPYAKYFCKGIGYDIGCGKEQWAYPGSIPIDIQVKDQYTALNLPKSNVDYIFSSHCLQHLNDWVETMDYWYENLSIGGILFLYLPSYQQQYWRPWNNYKHKNVLSSEIIRDYMINKGYKNIFVSGIDLNYSFMVVGQKG